MKISRQSLTETLEAHGSIEPPAPNPAFVDALERRLVALDLNEPTVPSNVHPFRRRLSRGAAIGVAAALVGSAAAAAVAIVAVRHDDPPTIVTPVAPTDPAMSTTPTVTTASSPTTALPPTTVPPTTVPATTQPATTVPTVTAATVVIEPITVPTTEVATTVPETTTTMPTTTQPAITEPPTTVAVTVVVPVTEPPTTSTEVHTPATLGLDCVLDTISVTCTWTAGPDGTARYVLLRSTPSETKGRVLSPEPGALSFTDSTVVAGNTYTYLVHALDANDASLAHSAPITLACCG
jgi:hypothetical protein